MFKMQYYDIMVWREKNNFTNFYYYIQILMLRVLYITKKRFEMRCVCSFPKLFWFGMLPARV